MAHTVVTRVGDNFCKKLLSQMIIRVDSEMRKELGTATVPVGNYLVGRLPAGCIVQNSYLFAVTANTVAADIDVGTAEAGIQILDSGAAGTAGPSGTAGAKFHTGTGADVFMKTSAALDKDFVIVIEYLELDVKTGSMTKF